MPNDPMTTLTVDLEFFDEVDEQADWYDHYAGLIKAFVVSVGPVHPACSGIQLIRHEAGEDDPEILELIYIYRAPGVEQITINGVIPVIAFETAARDGLVGVQELAMQFGDGLRSALPRFKGELDRFRILQEQATNDQLPQ